MNLVFKTAASTLSLLGAAAAVATALTATPAEAAGRADNNEGICGSNCGGPSRPSTPRDNDRPDNNQCSWTLNANGTGEILFGERFRMATNESYSNMGTFINGASFTVEHEGGSATLNGCLTILIPEAERKLCSDYGADAVNTLVQQDRSYAMSLICPTTQTPEAPVVTPRTPTTNVTPRPRVELTPLDDDLSVVYGSSCLTEVAEFVRSDAQSSTPSGFRVDRVLRNEGDFSAYETSDSVIACDNAVAYRLDKDRNPVDECPIIFNGGWTDAHTKWAIGEGECPVSIPAPSTEVLECPEQTIVNPAAPSASDFAELAARLSALEESKDKYCAPIGLHP